MDVPYKHTLKDDGDKGDDEDGKEDGLVVEGGDCLWCGADFGKEVKLSHLLGGGVGGATGRRG